MDGVARRGAWPLPLILLALVAPAVEAQRDSVAVRTVSTWQQEVDRLKRELNGQRQIEVVFLRMLDDIDSRVRSSTRDSLRALVGQRLQQASNAQLRIRQNLESMCSSVPKPEGWLGVATTGMSAYDRQGDGPQVVRFFEPPVVESVDPGSPAERVGLRSGDVLIEIADQPLLGRDIVFAEILRPGEQVNVKLRRGREVLVLKPRVAAVPTSLSRTPCSLVDVGTAFLIAPVPGESFDVQVNVDTDVPESRSVVTGRIRARPDTSAMSIRIPESPGGLVAPMARWYTRGPNPVAGLQIFPIDRDLSKMVGTERGLFVLQALEGTPGRTSGLRGGDVILSANGTELRSPAMLRAVIDQAREKRSVNLVILRSGKQEKITLTWPADPRGIP
jgi:C-terminal processing protease CtpA/Prc